MGSEYVVSWRTLRVSCSCGSFADGRYKSHLKDTRVARWSSYRSVQAIPARACSLCQWVCPVIALTLCDWPICSLQSKSPRIYPRNEPSCPILSLFSFTHSALKLTVPYVSRLSICHYRWRIPVLTQRWRAHQIRPSFPQGATHDIPIRTRHPRQVISMTCTC